MAAKCIGRRWLVVVEIDGETVICGTDLWPTREDARHYMRHLKSEGFIPNARVVRAAFYI